eukprot:CAMPEP_0174707282 /NCGR_PEP_ID=MMETSP1094-20130205/9840_1 /TAXON_ID=156173 /ORGANISM="Chrysochromulina brevifilum, Strain UTEX LB 985" /LENGTH=57 /DNA_ID=CAMNT_0015905641 /DNA_START=348 /DNA_END=521 /DNA_ORIENTATION=+
MARRLDLSGCDELQGWGGAALSFWSLPVARLLTSVGMGAGEYYMAKSRGLHLLCISI